MWRRLAMMLVPIVLAMACCAGWLAQRSRLAEIDAVSTERSGGVAHGFARELLSRLQMADALVQYLTSSDAGIDGEALRQRVRQIESFRSVMVVPWPGERTGIDASAGLPKLTPSDLLTLSGGQSMLRAVSPDEGRLAIYFLHIVNVNGVRRIAFFEFSPSWLWQGGLNLPNQLNLEIVDASRRVVFKTSDMTHDVVRDLVIGTKIDVLHPNPTTLRDWTYNSERYRGAVMRIDFSGSGFRGEDWNVIAFGTLASSLPVAIAPSTMMLLLLAVGTICAAFGIWMVLGRWQPVLRRLQHSATALRDGRFEHVELDDAADAPRMLALVYNDALSHLQRRTLAQQHLADIDRLLLEAADLEHILEPLLKNVCALSGAHFATLALMDRDAPGHARAFTANADGSESPVRRINFDSNTTDALQAAPQGFSVDAEQLARFSFLEPLLDAKAQYSQVWPVVLGDSVVAVLSIGYRDSALPTPEQLQYCLDCATRLRVALSNQQRDEKLYHQAHFDSLTSLPNRLLFRDRLSQELAATANGLQRGALLYVDLDHFKKVNDTVGHIAGDQLLTIVAQRLRSCVKEGDTVARLGGDEFTVILRNVTSAEAADDIAQRIIESLQRPVNIAGRDHHVRASIGITLFPDDGSSIEELMRNADLAMYQAKDGGRSRAVFFDSKLAHTKSPVAESGLFRALRRREFSLVYQPQYMLHTGQLQALEALIRWQNPREGMRFPKDFVPAAEESGLIVDIGAWVLEHACQQLAMWREEGIAPNRLALNVSVQQLRIGDFTKLVRQTLDRVGIPPHMLELEVTESVFAEEEARATLRNLAALGVRLALDDFGTGYSSLNYLRLHPVDVIKIDRSFMQEVPESTQAATLASTIIDMAHALGKQVVAEGVETVKQLEFLRERGCDVAQGFVLGRPVGVDEISELLSARLSLPTLLRAAS